MAGPGSGFLENFRATHKTKTRRQRNYVLGNRHTAIPWNARLLPSERLTGKEKKDQPEAAGAGKVTESKIMRLVLRTPSLSWHLGGFSVSLSLSLSLFMFGAHPFSEYLSLWIDNLVCGLGPSWREARYLGWWIDNLVCGLGPSWKQREVKYLG